MQVLIIYLKLRQRMNCSEADEVIDLSFTEIKLINCYIFRCSGAGFSYLCGIIS